MDNRPVLFFDSGVGGLPYLERAKQQLPDEQYIYLADHAHFPYGLKPMKKLKEIILGTVGRAIRCFHPKTVVLACNTATVIALTDLRERHDLPFIGVVPAVKPAAQDLRGGKLGVLATRRTVEGIYLKTLIRNFAEGCEVVTIPLSSLVQFVEERYILADSTERLQAVRREEQLQTIRKANISVLVLGCTHFLLMEEEIMTVVGGIPLIDSREGVINQLARVLKAGPDGLHADGLHAIEPGPKSGRFYITGAGRPEGRYYRFAERYGLSFEGILPG